MVSPIKGSPLKRSTDELKTPPASPHKPLPSPSKKARFETSINGLSVEPISPHQSPHKRLNQAPENLAEKPSIARRNLNPLFLNEGVKSACAVAQTFLLRRKSSRSLEKNIAKGILIRTSTKGHLFLDAGYWKVQAEKLAKEQIEKGTATENEACEGIHEINHEILRSLHLAFAAEKDPKCRLKLLGHLIFKQIEMEDYGSLAISCDDYDRLLQILLKNKLTDAGNKFQEIFITQPLITAHYPKECADILLLKGLCALQACNFPDAVKIYNEAIKKCYMISIPEIHDDDHIYLLKISIIRLTIALIPAEKNDQLSLELLKLISGLQYLTGQIENALSTLQAQEELDPGSTLLRQGALCFRLERIDDAVEALTEALDYRYRYTTESFQDLLSLALKLQSVGVEINSEGMLRLSLEYFDWILSRPLDLGQRKHILTLKYQTCVLLKDYTAAIALRRFLRHLDPHNPAHLIFEAECCFKLGRTEQAVQLLREAYDLRINLSPEITESLLERVLDLISDDGSEDVVQAYTNWINDITQQMHD